MAIKERYIYRLVDHAGNIVEPVMAGLSGGVLNANVDATIRWAGTVDSERPIWFDPWRYRVQVVHVSGVGLETKRVIGTFHVRPKSWETGKARHVETWNLYDLSIHVSEDENSTIWTETKGSNVADRIEWIIRQIGLNISITDSAATLRREMVWEETESKLTIVNGLAQAGGFFALHTNPFGQFQLAPYREPQSRPVVYRFATAPDAIHTADVEGEHAQVVPNKVIAHARGDGDNPDLVSIAVDYADVNATGVYRSRTYDVEAASQAVLDAHAKRLLATARNTSRTVTRYMLQAPLALNDVVSDVTGARYVVETIDMDIKPGALMRVGLREIREG